MNLLMTALVLGNITLGETEVGEHLVDRINQVLPSNYDRVNINTSGHDIKALLGNIADESSLIYDKVIVDGLEAKLLEANVKRLKVNQADYEKSVTLRESLIFIFLAVLLMLITLIITFIYHQNESAVQTNVFSALTKLIMQSQ